MRVMESQCPPVDAGPEPVNREGAVGPLRSIPGTTDGGVQGVTEFGVVLAGSEERMPFQFDQLHQASIRGRAAHHISGFQEKIAIGVVEFVAVAVAFETTSSP